MVPNKMLGFGREYSVREHTLGSTEAYLDVLGLGRGSRTRGKIDKLSF
jgi:hypothetical protein